MIEPIRTLNLTTYNQNKITYLCDATNINLPFNLPSINMCIIPAYENIIAAIIIVISLLIFSKYFWGFVYEKKYYKGAGADYFHYGKKYVREKVKEKR